MVPTFSCISAYLPVGRLTCVIKRAVQSGGIGKAAVEGVDDPVTLGVIVVAHLCSSMYATRKHVDTLHVARMQPDVHGFQLWVKLQGLALPWGPEAQAPRHKAQDCQTAPCTFKTAALALGK